MYSLLAYIIQVNILLAIVYIGYYALLKKLTFYKLNRGYFLLGVVFSFVYPFLDIKSLFRQHMEPIGELMAYLPDLYTEQVEKSVYTLENAIYISIGLVGIWFGVRLSIQLLSLLRIHLHSRKTVWKTYWYQNVLFPIVPFSFLNKIYLHKEQHAEPELYDIFEHENIHVKGLHSVDILLFEILLILCWYNPFVWFMRSAVRQNLEYLTDQQVLNKGVDRQTYQYSLLQVSKQGASLGLSNQFNFKFLKKRIIMMNRKKSSKLELGKYAFLLPVVIFSAGAFTIGKAESKITEVAEVVRDVQLPKISTQQDTTKKQKRETKRLESKSEIDQTQNYVYLYDKEELSKDDFFRIDDSELYNIMFIAGADLKGPYAKYGDKDGIIQAHSEKEQKKQEEKLQKAVYVIDGKRMLPGYDINKLNPNDIQSMTIRKKSADAIAQYGAEAANGVIEITTKAQAKQDSAQKSPEQQVDIFNTTFQYDNTAATEAEASRSVHSIEIRGEKRDSADTAENVTLAGKSTGLRVVGSRNEREGLDTLKGSISMFTELAGRPNPMYVIDGKEQKDELSMRTLDPNQIKSVSVLKGESATSLYGDKAKDGAVFIITKGSEN